LAFSGVGKSYKWSLERAVVCGGQLINTSSAVAPCIMDQILKVILACEVGKNWGKVESLRYLLTNCGSAMEKHTANVNKIAGNTMWECVPSRR